MRSRKQLPSTSQTLVPEARSQKIGKSGAAGMHGLQLVEDVFLGVVQRHPNEASGSMQVIRNLGYRDVRKLAGLYERRAAAHPGLGACVRARPAG